MTQNKLHILQVPVLRYPEIIGGVDNMVHTLTDTLKDHAKVSIFVPGLWQQKTLSEKKYDDVMVYSIRLRMPFINLHQIKGFLAWLIEFPQTLLALKKMIKHNKIDLIHLHLANSSQFYFIFLKWLTGIPYVLTLHRSDIVDFDDLSFMDKLLVKWVLSESAHINAVSRWLATAANDKFPKIKSISTIYNGINLDEIENIVSNTQASKYKFPYFLMIGSFDPYKEHLTAIEAWKYLKDSYPQLHLIIAGEGILQPEYESLIAKNDCQETIHLIGQVSHPKVLELLKFANGMILPSSSEGLPYVLLEAGAMNTPVICSAIYPFLELIEDQKNGLTFPLYDSIALAEAVKKLTDNPEWSKDLANRLKETIYKDFSSAKMTEEYLKIYKQILLTT